MKEGNGEIASPDMSEEGKKKKGGGVRIWSAIGGGEKGPRFPLVNNKGAKKKGKGKKKEQHGRVGNPRLAVRWEKEGGNKEGGESPDFPVKKKRKE